MAGVSLHAGSSFLCPISSLCHRGTRLTHSLLSRDKRLSTSDTNRPIGRHCRRTVIHITKICFPATTHSTTGSQSLNITYKFHAFAYAVPLSRRLSYFALQQDTGLCGLHKPVYVSDAPCQCWTGHSLSRMPWFHPR